MSLTLPFASAVPSAQALQGLAASIRLGPGVSNAVGGSCVLVIATIWGNGEHASRPMTPDKMIAFKTTLHGWGLEK